MEARRVGSLGGGAPERAETPREELVFSGISAAPGIVIGRAYVMNSEAFNVPKTPVPTRKVAGEVAAFKRALDATREEITQIKTTLAQQMGDDHARIFDAHLLILDDVMVVDDTEAVIRNENRNAAWAFQDVINNVVSTFADIDDEYLKDRQGDILDVKKRVIAKLLGRESKRSSGPERPSIIVAHELAPSETAQLNRKMVRGYATDRGGRTSHTAIMSRSQGVPAVVGINNLSASVRSGDALIIDGNTGRIVVNPTAETIITYENEIEQYKKIEEQLLTLTGYPAETLDNRKIDLHANIDLPDEARSAMSYGARGIGLFRTEYFFIAQEQLPSEDDQFRIYKSVVETMKGRPVTIRVLDIGGDKVADYLHGSAELNPFMGWRGIRFLLTRKDIFKTQLRAIYRASRYGKVRILLPLIVGIEEVREAKAICAEVQEELRRRRFKIGDDVELGIMIETPSAVAMADVLAKETDFFSIGTNDLIQYTLAVDRGNSQIAYLYQHLHPSIIRFLRMAIEAGHKRGIEVGVCGEMAVDPLSVIILIGLRVDELSCSPNTLPEIKKIIRSVTYDECKTLVRRVLRYGSVERTENAVIALLRDRCPDLPMFHEGP